MLMPAPVMAQDLVFDIVPVETCIRAGGGEDCAGLAAEQCIETTPGGYNTFVMVACIDRELTQWDRWLNNAYRQLFARLSAKDAQAPPHAIRQAEALRDMQRAWIGFRDAKCGYAASQWGDGTGARPATADCLLQETARQMLYLKSSELGE